VSEESRAKVLVVVGTRPEAVKLVPLVVALRESRCFDPVVVSTGQHHAMVAEVFALAEIVPEIDLWARGRDGRLNELVTSVMRRFEDYCTTDYGDRSADLPNREEVLAGDYPAAVLVHGDTSSAMAAALAAFHLRIPVVHVEAGLRTGSSLSPFPEEMNRELLASLACFHLAPTTSTAENLIRENVAAAQVFVTGNTGIDALRWSASLDVPFVQPEVQGAFDSDDEIVVVTAHRRENWGGGLAGVAAAIARLSSERPELRFVVPLHPNPIVRAELGEPLRGNSRIVLADPLGYAQFARLLGRSHLVITDSGGIQEEAPSLGKPVIVCRDTTERTEGVDAGTLLLAGTDPDRIIDAANLLLDDPDAYREMSEAENPYGDGHASERIVAALEHLRYGGVPPTPYGPGYERRAVLDAAGYARALDPDQFPDHERGLPEPSPPDSGESWSPK
jgi:UDP-N-acetylglucosamine 2-epimerase (non-hydrolysing)